MELLILLGLVGVAGAFVGLVGDDDPEPQEEPMPEEDPDAPDFFSIDGTPRAEEIEGTEASDEIEARGGDDLVHGYGGDDMLRGGSGEDTLVGGDGNDTIEGGRGDDRIVGDEGDDALDGGEGGDWLRGGSGDDTLLGGEGDDTLSDGSGTNTLFGGAGNDRISGSGLFTILGEPAVPAANLIDGGSGGDFINFAGNSTVTGGSGADGFVFSKDMRNDVTSRIEDFDPDEDRLTIYVYTQGSDGGGFNLIPREDGLGRDLYLDNALIVELLSTKSFTLADLNISVDILETTNGVSTYTVGPDDVAAGIFLEGSQGDDSISGNADDDLLRGFNGSDTLAGGAGNDRLIGGARSDVLNGGDGNDTLTAITNRVLINNEVSFLTDTLDGGDGDDLLIANRGHVATGGDGSDVFGVVPGANTALPGDVHQPTIITDFDPTEDFVVIGQFRVDAPPAPSDITIRILDDGTGAEVLVEGLVAAIVYGGQDLTAADIQIGDFNFTGDYRTP